MLQKKVGVESKNAFHEKRVAGAEEFFNGIYGISGISGVRRINVIIAVPHPINPPNPINPIILFIFKHSWH